MITALRSGNTAGLQAATAGLMEQVQRARWPFNPEQSADAVLKELRKKATPSNAPAGTFPHEHTGQPEPRRIILDSTYLNESDHKVLWQWLYRKATPDELRRIVEVNTKP